MLSFQTRWWLSWILVATAAIIIIYWSVQQAGQTRVIRIATAASGGYYYEYGAMLKEMIEQQGRYDVELIETKGSVDNRGRLLKEEADLAIIMIGSATLRNLELVAPLWQDYMHLIVRKNSKIKGIMDIKDHNIALGSKGSGYRAQSMLLLEHLGINESNIGMNELYFSKLLDTPELEGAIVTTGMLNPDLRAVLMSGEFKLLSIDLAEGYALNHSQISTTLIKPGTYTSAAGPLPTENIATLGTLAVLAARPGLPNDLIDSLHSVLFSEELRRKAPVMVDLNPLEDRLLRYMPMHQASARYYNPYAGFNELSRSLSWFSQNRWLVMGILIGIIAGWLQIKYLKRLRHLRKRNHLETGLEKIFREAVELERAQKSAKDIRLLHQQLNEALTLKNQAVSLAQGNHLNDSMLLLTTLQQCGDVMRQIEWRLAGLQVHEMAQQQAKATAHH